MRTPLALTLALILSSGCLLPPALAAQELLDRVVARVGGSAITLSDVNAAMALGVVEDADLSAGVQALINRQLTLAEVARFAPPEPDPAAVASEVERMKARAGSRLQDVMQSTGVDETRLRATARDTLRIRAYLNQRFGVTVQVSDEEVAQYYRDHPQEFMRAGVLLPFIEAEPLARTRAAEVRRAATIAQWMQDLRARAEVAIPRPR